MESRFRLRWMKNLAFVTLLTASVAVVAEHVAAAVAAGFVASSWKQRMLL